ncbi:MAG: hypothetical protein LUE31_08250 [Lachnospiraceae bacterium]|nr:hypothetical protein [Lachnospiraceae bacterium]
MEDSRELMQNSGSDGPEEDAEEDAFTDTESDCVSVGRFTVPEKIYVGPCLSRTKLLDTGILKAYYKEHEFFKGELQKVKGIYYNRSPGSKGFDCLYGSQFYAEGDFFSDFADLHESSFNR